MGILQNHRYYTIPLILILWLSNYWICEYFYSDNVPRWWDVKQSIYNICIILSLISISIETKGYIILVIDFMIGVIISSIIDRLFYDINSYDSNDITMITLSISITVLKFIKMKKCQKKHIKSY